MNWLTEGVVSSGAGVGGLTAALALSKYEDIAVDLYESASQLAEIGAGIGVFGRACTPSLFVKVSLTTGGRPLEGFRETGRRRGFTQDHKGRPRFLVSSCQSLPLS